MPSSKPSYMVAISLLVLSACTSPPGATRTYRFGEPVETKSDALIAARSALLGRLDYEEPFRVVSAEQMTYGEYSTRFAAGYDRPGDLRIWLVIYYDAAWRVAAPSVPPFPGCMRVAINADDGSPLEVLGPLRKGMIAECDS